MTGHVKKIFDCQGQLSLKAGIYYNSVVKPPRFLGITSKEKKH